MKFDLSTAHSTAANVPNNQKPTAQSHKRVVVSLFLMEKIYSIGPISNLWYRIDDV